MHVLKECKFLYRFPVELWLHINANAAI
jgi:hypothetical protein